MLEDHKVMWVTVAVNSLFNAVQTVTCSNYLTEELLLYGLVW